MYHTCFQFSQTNSKYKMYLHGKLIIPNFFCQSISQFIMPVQWLAKYGFVISMFLYIEGTTSCNLAARRETKWLPLNSVACQRNKQTIIGGFQKLSSGQGKSYQSKTTIKTSKCFKTDLIISKITKMYFNNSLCYTFHYCFTVFS